MGLRAERALSARLEASVAIDSTLRPVSPEPPAHTTICLDDEAFAFANFHSLSHLLSG